MRRLAVSALRSLSARAAVLADRLSPCEEISLESLAEASEDADRRLDELEGEIAKVKALAQRVSALEALGGELVSWASSEERLRPQGGQWPQLPSQELEGIHDRAREALRRIAGWVR